MPTTAFNNKQYTNHLEVTTTYVECLLQLFYGVTWVGNLISKAETKKAIVNGHAVQVDSWVTITNDGIWFLIDADYVRS